MGVLDLIRRRGPMNQTANMTGLLRIGGTTYQADGWTFQRIATSVYRNPTGYRCVRAYANNFKRPDFIVRDPDSPQDFKQLEDHPAIDVVQRPNKRMSGTEWLDVMGHDVQLCGKHLMLKLYGDDGQGTRGSDPLTGMQRLTPQRVTVIGNSDDQLLGFIYRDLNGRGAIAVPDDVVYIRAPHPERWFDGLAPAIVAGLPAETDTQATKHNFELLSNDGGVPGYISVSGLSTEDFSEWKRLWESGEVAGKMRFLGGDGSMTVAKVGMTNQELQYDKLPGQAQSDILKAFGANLTVIGQSSQDSDPEADKVGYIQGTIDPDWVSLRDSLTMQIVEVDHASEPGIIDLDKRLIAELHESADAVHKREMDRTDRGIDTRNEIRVKHGQPTIEGGDVPIFMPGTQFGSMDGLPVDASEEMGQTKLDAAKAGADLASQGAALGPEGRAALEQKGAGDSSQSTSAADKADGSPAAGGATKPKAPSSSRPTPGAGTRPGTPSGGRAQPRKKPVRKRAGAKALNDGALVLAEDAVIDRTLERMKTVMLKRAEEKGSKGLVLDEDRWSRELREDGVSPQRAVEVMTELSETFYGVPDMGASEAIDWVERSVRR